MAVKLTVKILTMGIVITKKQKMITEIATITTVLIIKINIIMIIIIITTDNDSENNISDNDTNY